MKIAYILAVMLVVFMVGCATTMEEPADEPAPAAPAEEPEETPEEPVEEEPEEPVEEAPMGGDVLFIGKEGFDPEEITIAAGSTLSIAVNDEGSVTYTFAITETGERSAKVANGEMAELAFEEAGTYTIMSIPFSKKMTVIVE